MFRSLALGLSLAALGALPGVAAAQPAITAVSNDTPAAVAQGQASLLGDYDTNTVLNINVGLAVREPEQLNELIAAASTPGSPDYGHYLTNAQYMARFAPTGAQVDAAESWLASRHLTVTGASPDNLLVHVRARASVAERAFGVAIDNYLFDGREFHANDRDPAVPSGLDVGYVSGLSNYEVFKPAITCTPSDRCGYDGGDFRAAYNIVGNGEGQTLGYTLWGRALPQEGYTEYAKATGETPLTVGGSGNNGLDFIPVDGTTTETGSDTEVALDTEIAHGVAPGIHETYWLGDNNENSTLETVLDDAANSSISVISDSWGAQGIGCPADPNMETALQHGAATGKTFYFATGDSGAASGCSWPAESQYVVAVGGTELFVGAGSEWSSENAFDNGGGCSDSEPRPSWQTGIGTAFEWPSTSCTGRAEPDVSADSGIGTYLYYDGEAHCCTGGTSLATPIWAALSVIWNNNNAAAGRPAIGFSAPLIYALANDPTTYAKDFHDITTGSNGFKARKGWDEATGWGSPDFDNLSNNKATITYTGPTSASKGSKITLSGDLYDEGTTRALKGRTITFSAAGATCKATTATSGKASCAVTITAAPGHYTAGAAFAGDAAYDAVSTSTAFTVLHIPTTITYTGPTSAVQGHAVTLSATLTDNSDGKGISGQTLSFTVGAEHCTGTTNSNGEASCPVTPTDAPGSYTLEVSFAGDEPTYEPSSTTAAFIIKGETKTVAEPLFVSGPPQGGVDTYKVSATLTSEGVGLPGETITFSVGATTLCSAVTNSSGVASCMITAKQELLVLKAREYTATFAGETYYLGSSGSTGLIEYG
jgi:kumamolisin